MRGRSGSAPRLLDKVGTLVDALSRGADRLLGDLAGRPQPQLVPVRVRDDRRTGRR